MPLLTQEQFQILRDWIHAIAPLAARYEQARQEDDDQSGMLSELQRQMDAADWDAQFEFVYGGEKGTL